MVPINLNLSGMVFPNLHEAMKNVVGHRILSIWIKMLIDELLIKRIHLLENLVHSFCGAEEFIDETIHYTISQKRSNMTLQNRLKSLSNFVHDATKTLDHDEWQAAEFQVHERAVFV